VEMTHISWNYTTFLNIAFAAFSVVLILRFTTTGGPKMLRMMSAPHHAKGAGGMHDHRHAATDQHDHHGHR
jgi:hypothetical protein